MQVHVSNDAASSVATGALVVPVFAGGAVTGVAAEVDRVLGGAIADILASGEITGKPNETSLVHAKDAPFKRVLVVGLGEREKFNVSGLAKYAGTAVRYLGKRGVTALAIALPEGVDAARMEELGMGSLLGVSRGSDEPATLSVLTYKGDPSSTETIALVGKGLTFDSGGISIKPAENMHEMKYDMSGGAGVIAALWAIGKLRPKVNVIGLVPSSENLPGHRAMKPGDILKAMNGKTIEVINTDAEGRLILADALCYARKLGATKIIDAATLTGACVIALGHAASGTMSNDDAFVERFLKTVADCGERYWRLPLYPDYDQQIKSDIADLKNTGGRAAGAETAGTFLKHFVAETPWIHLDVAGTAYLDGESSYMAKGPTGTPVRAFVNIVEDLAKNGAPANGVAKSAAAAAV